jgi:C1A family cysteine protease
MKMKKTIALLSGLVMALPCTPCAAFAAEENIETETADTTEITEEVKEDAEVQHLYPAPAASQADTAAAEENDDYELPSKFDLRTNGLVSSIKNQGEYGTCWAHAVLGSLETDRMAEDPHIDLSERYLGTYIVSEEYGDGTIEFGSGANAGDALGLLTNWIGAVSETVAPYDVEYTSDLSRKELQKQSELHVTGAHCFDFFDHTTYERIPENDLFFSNIKEVKKAICNGHAIYLTMRFDEDDSYNYLTNAMYNPPSSSLSINHAVVIVGYDDDYSADNFNTSPGKNGAWLIKNSWGAEKGNNGYYWVSYYDYSIREMQYFDEAPTEMHDHLYSYDDCGVSGQFGISEEGDTCTYISNEYTAEENGFITDIMLNCCVPNDEYEITVYTDVADADVPTSGEAHSTTVGTMEHMGYQTVTLTEPVHISEGETFAVVAKINGEQGYHIACEYAFNNHGEPVGYTDHTNNLTASQALISEAKIMKTFAENQSFFSSDGQNWTDLYESYDYDNLFITGNLCLRAMTCDEGAVHFSSYSDALAPGTEISLSCADGKDIYYSVDNGEYQLYTVPVTFTKDMTISAYAEGDEDKVFSKHYAEKHAEIVNMLVTAGYKKFYVDTEKNTDIILPVEADQVSLLPILNGVLNDGETVTNSYEERTYQCGMDPFNVKLTAEKEGLQPTEYTFRFKKECAGSFTNGIWVPRNAKSWYYFSEDGKTGYHIDRATGVKTEFTYTIADNKLTITSKDSVRKGVISLNYHTAQVQWDNGDTDFIDLWNSGEENAPFYTNVQLCEYAKKYMTELTGEEPVSVKADFNGNNTIAITVKLASGQERTFYSSGYSLLCTDQNDYIIDLENVPQDTGVTAFKQGIWSVNTGESFLYYIYFDANGKDCTIFTPYDGRVSDVKFSLENGQLKIDHGYGEIERAAATVWEDKASLKYIYGATIDMKYISDATPENFHYLSNNEISELISNYYEATFCKENPYIDLRTEDDRYVTVYYVDKPYYLDQMSVIPFYHIDRMTGECTDENGEIIDLYHPSETQQTYFKRGLWRCDDFSGWGNDGYFWCSGNDGTVTYFEPREGGQTEFKYRFSEDHGIAYIGENKIYFSLQETETDTLLSWTDQEGMWHELRITYVKPIEKNEVKFYTFSQLEEMVLNDFIAKNGEGNYIALSALTDNGYVRIGIRDEDLHDFIELYTIDPFDGTGCTESGDYVCLVENNKKTDSVCDMIFTFLVNKLKFWLDILCDMFLN